MSERELKRLLNESSFNPRETTGPIKVILDSGNVNYYMSRAIEFIMQAQLEKNGENYHSCLRKAISLLAMARMINNQQGDNNVGEKNS